MEYTNAKPIVTTGQKARQYAQYGINFTNHNGQLFGRWETPSLYVIYSYGQHWPLFVWDETLSVWYENEDKCSRTTSRHRSQTNPLVPTELRSCGWLRTYITSQRFDRKAV
jgi:hypothetical protein